MDNKSTTKRMIGAVVLVLIAALLLAWLLKGKNKSVQEQQELIAEQTQEPSKILGFPGVNGEDSAGDGQVAANGEATEDGSYVIGSEQNTDGAAANTQQQVQDTLAAGGAAVSSAGQNLADGAGQVASTAAGAVAGAAAQVNQTGQQIANNATGFEVRDPNSEAGAEQRQIVENGEVKAGTGSMGGSEVATGTQDQSGDAAQAAATGGAAASQSSGGSNSGSAAQQTQQAASSGGSNGGDSGAAKPARKIANPRLVNEKPVPAPRTQSASSGNRSASRNRASTSSRSGSGSAARSSASSAAAGGSGYAIQVLAASKRSTAEGLRKDIARDGYPVFVVRARVNGKTVYRVRVGTYPGKSAARAVQTQMKKRYTQNQYIQNSFVTSN